MRGLKVKAIALVAAVALTTGVVGATAEPASAAANSLKYHTWSSAGITLRQGHTGNTIGFWQTILQSNQASICVDGSFGPITKSATQSFQVNVAGVTGDGIVGPNTWNGTQNALSVFGPRLTSIGGGQYTYYGGGALTTFFKKATWSGTYQWGFRKPGTSSSGTLHSSQRWVDTVTC